MSAPCSLQLYNLRNHNLFQHWSLFLLEIIPKCWLYFNGHWLLSLYLTLVFGSCLLFRLWVCIECEVYRLNWRFRLFFLFERWLCSYFIAGCFGFISFFTESTWLIWVRSFMLSDFLDIVAVGHFYCCCSLHFGFWPLSTVSAFCWYVASILIKGLITVWLLQSQKVLSHRLTDTVKFERFVTVIASFLNLIGNQYWLQFDYAGRRIALLQMFLSHLFGFRQSLWINRIFFQETV